MSLIIGRRSVVGWYAGTARDAQDTLEFSVLSAVHPMIEQYPLGRVGEAYDQMHSGRVRFRVGCVPIFPIRLPAKPGVKSPYVSTCSTDPLCSTTVTEGWPRHWRDTKRGSDLSSAN